MATNKLKKTTKSLVKKTTVHPGDFLGPNTL